MSLDSRLRDEFRSMAAAADSSMDPAALAHVVARAGRVRRQRRLTGGMIGAVIVGAVWFGAASVGGDGVAPVPPPGGPPGPTVTASGWAPVLAVGDQSVLDGTWRIVADAEHMRAAGVSSADVAANAGTWVFTIGNGRLHAVHGDADDCTATTTVDGDRWSVVWDPGGGCAGDFTVRFDRTGGAVRLSGTTSSPDASTTTLMDAFFAGGMELVPPG